MDTKRRPTPRNAARTRAARGWSEIPGADDRFERLSRWAFWAILFAGTAAAFWFR